MSKIRALLEDLVITEDIGIDQAEQSINNTRLTEEEIRAVFDTFIEVGENKLKMMYDKEMSDKLTHAIYEAQTKKLE